MPYCHERKRASCDDRPRERKTACYAWPLRLRINSAPSGYSPREATSPIVARRSSKISRLVRMPDISDTTMWNCGKRDPRGMHKNHYQCVAKRPAQRTIVTDSERGSHTSPHYLQLPTCELRRRGWECRRRLPLDLVCRIITTDHWSGSASLSWWRSS